MLTFNELIPIHEIKISPLRPPLSLKPYIKPTPQEVETAKLNQLIPPLTVKLQRKFPHPLYIILQGERSWFLAQKAGIHSVICEVIDDPISEKDELTLIKNELNSYAIKITSNTLDPIASAEQLKHEIETAGSQYQYAKDNKTNQGTISHQLNLLKLSQEVKALISKYKLSPTHARFLHQLPKTEQLNIAKHIISHKMSASQSWKLTKEFITAGRYSKTSYDANIVRLEKQVSESIGFPVKIKHKRKGSGKIIIEYFDLDEAQTIFTKLGYKSEEF